MPNTILDFCIYCVIFICEETGIQDYIVKAKCICLMHSEAKKKKKKKKKTIWRRTKQGEWAVHAQKAQTA